MAVQWIRSPEFFRRRPEVAVAGSLDGPPPPPPSDTITDADATDTDTEPPPRE